MRKREFSKRAPGGFRGSAVVCALICAGLAALLLSAGCNSLPSIAVATNGASTTPSTAPTSYGTPGGTSSGALLLGVMVHVEGWRNEARDQQAFQQHAGMIRQYAAIFEKYGLRLTFEASPEFTQACARWNDNVLKELSDKGHGIGVHADLGA
ncbi:MAG: hypothetical protein ACYC99_14405, partial [Candidatus Geothermincolia bacterium]